MQNKVTGVVADTTISKYQNNFMTEVISPLIGLATAVAFALFLYGVLRFFINRAGGNVEEIEKGKKHMIWGILALTILISMWSILKGIGGVFSSNFWFVKQ